MSSAIKLLLLGVLLNSAWFAQAYANFQEQRSCFQTDQETFSGSKTSKFGQYVGYSKAQYNTFVRTSQYVRMSDGVEIAIDIYIPANDCKPMAKKFPVVLTQTPYQRAYINIDGRIETSASDFGMEFLLAHGYAILTFSARGTAASGGIFPSPFTAREGEDAYEMIEWAAKQEFSTGNVGMIGGSYQGITQLMAAATNPPHLRALFPSVTAFNFYDFVYPGGIFRNGFLAVWTANTFQINNINPILPVDQDQTGYKMARARLEHKGNTNIYKSLEKSAFQVREAGKLVWAVNSPFMVWDKINQARVPCYLAGSWNDFFSADNYFIFNNYKGPKKLLMGAWPHSTEVNGTKYADALSKERKRIEKIEALRWFDYWLKGIKNGIMDEKPIHYNVMTAPLTLGEWKSTCSFRNEKKAFYFTLTPNNLNGEQPSHLHDDTYSINFSQYTDYFSRRVKCNWNEVPDFSFNDNKALTYTTAPFGKDITIHGYPVIHLNLIANVSDVDILVLLEIVNKRGESFPLSEGAMRASHRKLSSPNWDNLGLPYHTFTKEDQSPIREGETISLDFYLQPLAYKIQRGERLRVAIMGSDMKNLQVYVPEKQPKIYIRSSVRDPSYVSIPLE